MLSIIVCSVKPALLHQLKSNIETTIGIPYEILAWDNTKVGKGICEVYNELAEKAQYPFLCFCHEDILFETKDWGVELSIILKDSSNPPLVGIAGSKYKSRYFSGWYTGQKDTDFFYYTNLIGNKKKEITHPAKWSHSQQKVICIDGVFMACAKKIWQNIKFNQDELKGFHFYDLDFSLRVTHNFPVVVTNSIQIIHLSVSGDFGEKWVQEAFSFHEYMHKNLPISNGDYIIKEMDEKIINVWLDRLKNENINFKTRLNWVRKQQLQKKPIHWLNIIKFLSYQTTGVGRLIKFLKKN